MSDIRRLTEADLASVSEIENACFIPPLSPEQLKKQLNNPRVIALGAFDNTLVGFAFFSLVLDEAELLQIAVAPAYRGKGFGHRLLQQGSELLLQQQIQKMLLEVRESNQTAISLYRSEGFVDDGLRKNYYPPKIVGGEREAALLMSRSLKRC